MIKVGMLSEIDFQIGFKIFWKYLKDYLKANESRMFCQFQPLSSTGRNILHLLRLLLHSLFARFVGHNETLYEPAATIAFPRCVVAQQLPYKDNCPGALWTFKKKKKKRYKKHSENADTSTSVTSDM